MIFLDKSVDKKKSIKNCHFKAIVRNARIPGRSHRDACIFHQQYHWYTKCYNPCTPKPERLQ
jgi:hypothetical protein